jgi:primosomal protein N'
MQQLILDREREVHEQVTRQGQELAELRRGGGTAAELGTVLEKYGSVIPRGADGNPMAPQAVIESLLSAHHALETHPAAALAWLAQSYGVDLGQMTGAPQNHAAVQQLQNAYQQLQWQQQQQQHQRQQYLQEQILDYLKEEVHSPEVEDEMMRQVEAVKATNPRLFAADPMAVIKQAHPRALKIVPNADKKQADEAKKKADDAKRIASLNMKSNGISRSPGSVARSIWDSGSWDAAYDKATRR